MNNYDSRCEECANSKLKKIFDSEHKLYICEKHKAAVTDLTLAQSVIRCQGQDFVERKGE